MHNRLLKAIQETKVLFASCVDLKNYFCLKESRPVSHVESQAELQAEASLIVKELQKRACYLARIYHREMSK